MTLLQVFKVVQITTPHTVLLYLHFSGAMHTNKHTVPLCRVACLVIASATAHCCSAYYGEGEEDMLLKMTLKYTTSVWPGETEGGGVRKGR